MGSNSFLLTAIGPEDQLLLCCARLKLDPDSASRLATLIKGEFDWNYLVAAASRHAIIPLFYRHLNGIDSPAVPQEVLETLRTRVHETATKNLLMTSELLKILSWFEGQGISAVPLRGPALAAFAYGNLSLRQFSDLDILIHRHDVPKAKDLLISQGYQPIFSLSGSREAAYLKSQYDYEFIHPDSGVMVELHWEISPKSLSFPINLSNLEQRLERRNLAGRDISNLLPEDLLLVLCVHSAKHFWGHLLDVCDVATLLAANPGMDWEEVQAQAGKTGTRRLLFLGLLLAQDLLGAAIPKDVWQKIESDRQVKSLALMVGGRLFPESDSPPKVWENIRFYLKARERLRDKGRYLVNTAFNPTIDDWSLLPLPQALALLRRIFRPLRLIVKFRKKL
jgi:hypothetical protein